MTSVLLTGQGLQKSYPALKALKGVDISIKPKETLAVIGPNGAGKTTLFKVLTGEIPADTGKVELEGRDITRLAAHTRVRMGMGRTFQVARVFLEMTVLENVIVAIEAVNPNASRGLARFDWRPERKTVEAARDALNELGIDALRDEIPANLSHGDKKRLELASCIALQPRLLMLDEPTAGMSPADRSASVDMIASVRERRGLAVMLTEHDMGVVFGLADRLMVLNYGEVIAEGTGEEIRKNQKVRDIYLGSGAGHA